MKMIEEDEFRVLALEIMMKFTIGSRTGGHLSPRIGLVVVQEVERTEGGRV